MNVEAIFVFHNRDGSCVMGFEQGLNVYHDVRLICVNFSFDRV